MIKTLKAKWRKDTIFSKLDYLKREWIEGRATQADVPFWKTYLNQLQEDVLPYVKGLDEQIQEYTEIYNYQTYEVSRSEFEKSIDPILVIAGINGDVSHLKKEWQERQLPNGATVILGDILPGDERFEEALDELMDFVLDKRLFFVVGEKEKELYLEKELNDLQRVFIEKWPSTLDTPYYAFFADHEGEGVFTLNEVLEGDLPNLSEKLLVYPTTEGYKDGFKTNNDNQVIALTRGLMMILEMNSSNESEALGIE